MAEEKKELGNDKFKARDYQAALRLYSDAITLCPDSAAYYGNRAACLIMLEQYRPALKDAETATQLDKGFEKGYARIAKCSLFLGDLMRCEQAIKATLQLNPQSTQVRDEIRNLQTVRGAEQQAMTYYARGEHRIAVYQLDMALKVATACVRLKLFKAECLALIGRLDEASDIAVTAMQADSASVDAIYVRGLCLYYTDNMEKAMLHFERALRLDPDHKKAKETRRLAKQLKELREMGNEQFKVRVIRYYTSSW